MSKYFNFERLYVIINYMEKYILLATSLKHTYSLGNTFVWPRFDEQIRPISLRIDSII